MNSQELFAKLRNHCKGCPDCQADYDCATARMIEQQYLEGLEDKRLPMSPSTVDISTITEYGMKQKLSHAIRCF